MPKIVCGLDGLDWDVKQNSDPFCQTIKEQIAYKTDDEEDFIWITKVCCRGVNTEKIN